MTPKPCATRQNSRSVATPFPILRKFIPFNFVPEPLQAMFEREYGEKKDHRNPIMNAKGNMRAFAVRSFGEAPGLHDLPIPAEDGALLIRVRYAGVNPIDYKLLEKLTVTSRYPFVVGIDFAGVVEGVPAGESDLRIGERVFGMARTHGAYAEYTVVAPSLGTLIPLARIPDGLTDEQAASLPVAAIAALGSLELLGLTANQRLVVMGATGAVGGYAVQMARARGAHVIATVRGDADEARHLGAEEVYDTKAIEVIDALRTSHPDGVDAVLDLVNDSKAIRRDTEILRPGGSLVSTIFAADEGWFAERQIKAHNIDGNTNPLASREGLNQVARMLVEGKITARIRFTVELGGASQMFEKLRHGGLRGKAVVRL
jgi:NADPH:quinone reductase-like Zn-dependent oxidoreductase